MLLCTLVHAQTSSPSEFLKREAKLLLFVLTEQKGQKSR
jgi:hypothetical protein